MAAVARVSFASLVFAVLFVTGLLRRSDGSSEGHSPQDAINNINSSSVVVEVVGSNAYLSCQLPYTDVSTVVWLRQLDARSFVIEHQGPNERFLLAGKFLLIDSVRVEDAGVYLCFVFRAPGDLHWVLLSVVEPKIVGEPTRSVLPGDSVNLTCVIDPSPTSEIDIGWTRDAGDGTTRLSNDGRVTIVEERDTGVRSTLLIENVQVTDAGNYTCTPSEGNSTATVAVLVDHRQLEVGIDERKTSQAKLDVSNSELGSTTEVTTASAN